MTLADTAHGSDWILWGVFAVFVILTIALLSGHGSKFISGYNTASKRRKPDMMRKSCAVYTELEWTADHDQIRTSGP